MATTFRLSMALAAAGGTGFAGLADTLRVPSEFPTIRAAIQAAVDGDVVLVADGRYTGPDNRNLDFGGKAIKVRSENGPRKCIIDCQDRGRGFIFRSGETRESVVNGFTVTGGYASSAGGAFEVNGSSPIIRNCIISGNRAFQGGGIACRGGGNVRVANCIISGNLALDNGGGIFFTGRGRVVVSKTVILRNTAMFDGGGVWSTEGELRLGNCLMDGNTAERGGGVTLGLGTQSIVNCTFVNNTASELGGALFCETAIQTTLANSILRFNEAPLGREVALGDSSPTLTVSYSNVRGGRDGIHLGQNGRLIWGEGNVTVDPLLAFDGDGHLMPASPCIDMGTNDPPHGLSRTDAEGNPRSLDGDGDGNAIADMGAYEFDRTAPAIAISASMLTFQAILGGPAPADQTLDIRNSAAGTLRWEIANDCDWTRVEPRSGKSTGQSDTVTLSVDHSGLPRGIHGCWLTVSDSQAVNSPRLVAVQVAVNGTLRVPSEFATIQDAVDAAFDGDTILVADGVYTGTGNTSIFVTKAVTIRSENGPQNCVIDGEHQARGFMFTLGEVDGFTITNAAVNYQGAAIRAGRGAVIRNCIISNNSSDTGAGVNCYQGDVTISDCLFSGNISQKGGAIYADRADVAVLRCTFEQNSAYQGGAVYLEARGEGASTIVDCLFVDNSAEYEGGAIRVVSTALSVYNSVMIDNTAGGWGGAILGRGATLEITDCTVRGNAIDNPAGAGIGCIDGTLYLRNCAITENVGGGGILSIDTNATLIDCIIAGNSSPNYQGGGIDSRGGPLTMINCVVADNEAAESGGGIRAYGDTTLIGCLISGNRAGHFGGGLSIGQGLIANCTLVGNQAPLGSGMIVANARLVVQDSILWNDGADEIAFNNDEPIVRYSNIRGGWPGPGNIDAEPLFVDPADDDYRLAPGSPCIDAADNTAVPAGITTDLDGNPRFVDDPATPDTGVPGGAGGDAIVDMGAYEFPCNPCDMNCDGTVDASDIEFFIDMLFNGAKPCRACTGDTNGDGTIDALDIEPFLECLFS